MMYHNLPRKLPLAELARKTGMSVSRLGHMFKSQIGTSPKQYVKSLRLRRAKHLLENSTLSVKEVAGQVGLTAGTLIRQFRQAYGTPPRRHRQDWRARRKETPFGFERSAAGGEGSRIGL
jgi:transcriptional regulator GlxA family with amidase domain